jgi:hypothetical protein
MWTRWLALAATIWTAAYVVAYLAIIRQEGGSPAWWYVGLIAAGVLPLIAVVAGRLARPALVASAVVLGFASLLGLLSIGIFLLPAVMFVIVAALVPKPRTRPAFGPR